MVKATTDDWNRGAESGLAGGRTDQVPYRPLLEELRRTIPCSELVVLTSLPRGTLQIAQPARVPELLLKGYARAAYAHDRLSWRAMFEQRVVSDADVWGDGAAPGGDEPFFAQYLSPAGLRYAIAAPLAGPALEGYPGAIHLYRTAEQGPFSDADAEQLADLARRIDAAALEWRQAHRTGACRVDQTPWVQRPASRLFIVDSNLRSHPTGEELDVFDAPLREQIIEQARDRLQNLNGDAASADRIQLPDGLGGFWTFRVTAHRDYPAISAGGPVVFFCVLPECCDWGLLRPIDFQADPELARLIPALRFMQQEFHRSPSLKEISRQVHLSPFHFHRRFTELLGITPKHFLLDCQISQAKRELMERRKDLAQIATDCGFAHQSHFTSRFKQATGLTPTRWRRAYSADTK